MNYKQALEYSLTVEWKVSTCYQGKKCWCRTILPVEPIKYRTDKGWKDIDHIIKSGSIGKKAAKHIVALHNNFIKQR